jgi:hypothetical protein
MQAGDRQSVETRTGIYGLFRVQSFLPCSVACPPFGFLFVSVAYAVSALRYERSAHEIHYWFAVLFEGARLYRH